MIRDNVIISLVIKKRRKETRKKKQVKDALSDYTLCFASSTTDLVAKASPCREAGIIILKFSLVAHSAGEISGVMAYCSVRGAGRGLLK